MRARLIRLFIKVVVLATLMWISRRALIRWVDGPKTLPVSGPWPPIGATEEALPAGQTAPAAPGARPPAAAPQTAVTPDRTAPGAQAAGPAPNAPQTAVTVDQTAPAEQQATPPAVRAGAVPTDTAWLPPDASGTCPPTHPVKAKRSTRLYREPGTAAYDRARPDRCYVSAEAAEADGYTRAKR